MGSDLKNYLMHWCIPRLPANNLLFCVKTWKTIHLRWLLCICIYMVPSSVSPPPTSPPPMGWVPRYHPPFPSICKLLAAFLMSSFVFARSLQHFWLPALHLLGTCYLFGDLRSTHTPSKYPRDAYVLPIVIYIYIYTCVMYLLPIYYLCTLTTLPVFNIYSTYHTCQWCRAYHTYHIFHTYHTYHTYEM